MDRRKVTRVLVMLEYEAGDPDNGEVFDLTALVPEFLKPNEYCGEISLSVRATRSYLNDQPLPTLEASWRTMIGCKFSNSAGYLADAINTGLPDGPRVSDLRSKAKRLRKRAEKIDYDADVAKLEQVAAVRHLHPIARVTERAPELSDIAPTPSSPEQ